MNIKTNTTYATVQWFEHISTFDQNMAVGLHRTWNTSPRMAKCSLQVTLFYISKTSNESNFVQLLFFFFLVAPVNKLMAL